jgi:hypothetical protein
MKQRENLKRSTTEQQVAKKIKPNPSSEQSVVVVPQQPMWVGATYQEMIFYYGEKQMREELSGPAGVSIIAFVIQRLKLFLKEHKLEINRSQFVSFLDAWLEFLKRNHHVQDKANQSFDEWLVRLWGTLSKPDNYRCWNNGVIQGFISRTNVAKLRKNITDQIQEGVIMGAPRSTTMTRQDPFLKAQILVRGSPYPSYSWGNANAIEFGVVTIDLEGDLACATLHEGSRPPPAVAPDATHQPEIFTCKNIGELLPFCKVFFVSGQADREEKDKITKNQLAHIDDLIARKIICDAFYITNFYQIQDELELWSDEMCSKFLAPRKQEIGRKILVKMPRGDMQLITNWKKA